MAASVCLCSLLRRLESFRPVCYRPRKALSNGTHLFKIGISSSLASRRSGQSICSPFLKSLSSRWSSSQSGAAHGPSDSGHAKSDFQATQDQNRPQSLKIGTLINDLTGPGLKSEKENDKSKASSEEERKRKDEFQRKATKYALLSLIVMCSGTAGYLLAVWGAPPKDEEGNLIKDGFSDLPLWKAYIFRTWKEIVFYDKMIKEPSREKLLPDPLTEPYYQPPYTLVIEMTGVLVHPDWTYKTGWRFKKRPGVDFLLQQAGPPLFEIVVYTSEQGFTAYPILETLDPNGFIMYKLYRDATRYMNGHHIKDLACLNRDLSRVIIVDWNDQSFQLQPENSLKLKKWTGTDDDSTLFDLAMFLRTIAAGEVEDVRSVLQFYRQFDDPLAAFKENQRRLQEEEEKLSKQRVETQDKQQALTGAWSSGLFGRRR